ncbi:MAG TPA: hypothetical protein VKX39_03025 [Bryobacteraceae bacterium]|jgi:hypothetical protein|nr:hypothetical protein [Bryobacteraceae bacterium]
MSDIAMGYHDAHRSEAELFHRVSWAAIFSGVLVALAMELVFLMFGLFIGFQMSAGGAHAWSKIWYFVTLFCSLFIGSWVTARLAGNPARGNGMLHGFVVWGLTMFTTAVIAVMLMWDVIRLANSWLQSFVANVPPTAAPSNTSQLAATAAGDLSTLALVIWGGLLAAIVGSLLGGSVVPKLPNFITERRRLPEQPHHA